MKSNAAAISIQLPVRLAQTSQKLAKQLHMSRAEFIRMAIEHEIKNWRVKQTQMAMAKAFSLMNKNEDYLAESDEIMDGFHESLDDEDQWWKKK